MYTFLPGLWLLGGLILCAAVGVAAVRFARADEDRQPEARAAFVQGALDDLAARGPLAPMLLNGRTEHGPLRFGGWGAITVSSELLNFHGEAVARYRLHWGGGPRQAVVLTQDGQWRLQGVQGGWTADLNGQALGSVRAGVLRDASDQLVGTVRAGDGWQPVTLDGHPAGERRSGGWLLLAGLSWVGRSATELRQVPPDLGPGGRAWLTLLVLVAELERAQANSAWD